MSLEVNGKQYEVDEEGYLANLNDWDTDVANAMAEIDGAPLEENHWEVINFLDLLQAIMKGAKAIES